MLREEVRHAGKKFLGDLKMRRILQVIPVAAAADKGLLGLRKTRAFLEIRETFRTFPKGVRKFAAGGSKGEPLEIFEANEKHGILPHELSAERFFPEDGLVGKERLVAFA